MANDHATVAEEEYLQTIFWLQEARLPMTGANVARAMQLSAPTVHEMIGRLERDGYVTRGADKALSFTENGREHADRGARLDVTQRHAHHALPDVDRVPVRTRLRVADRGKHARLEHGGHRVLEPLGLLVDLVPRDPEDVRKETLDQPVAADDRLGVLAPRVGERDRLV